MTIFDNVSFYIVAFIVACCSAAGWAVIAGVFMGNIMDIKKRTDGDANLDTIPATLFSAVLAGVIDLAVSIWLYTFKSTGAVVSNLLAFTFFGVIAMFIITLIYKRIKNARPSVKPKGKYPRNW
jgi:hypothetical protein